MIKPEAIERDMVGRIINRFEDAGLKLEALKVATASRTELERHYREDRRWEIKVGKKAIKAFNLFNESILKYLGTKDAAKVGEMIYRWHIANLTGKKVVLGILSGPHAITRVKQIIGPTEPMMAPRGTIRGDWCTDSVIYANMQKRTIMNLVHRSSDTAEFERERAAWFAG